MFSFLILNAISLGITMLLIYTTKKNAINIIITPISGDPCEVCGPNTECRKRGSSVVCKCEAGYFGDAYSITGCRPECVTNIECKPTLSCVNKKCVDPCQEKICGLNAICYVVGHEPICRCSEGYRGDPTRLCNLIIIGNYL